METKTCTTCSISFPKTVNYFGLVSKKRRSGNGYCTYLRAVCNPCKYKKKQAWRKTLSGKLSRRLQRRKQRLKPHVKARKACSQRLKQFLLANGLQKDRSSSKFFNFTPRQLQEHLESHFTPEMSWDNYGSYWHIDHVIPLAYYNIKNTDDPRIKEAWKLENLKPLEAIKNLQKGSNYKGERRFYNKN